MSATVLSRSRIQLEDVRDHLQLNGMDVSSDRFIQHTLLPGIKILADAWCGKLYTIVPENIELWILGMCFRYFECKANGVFKESDASGNVEWDKFIDYQLIHHDRSNPGL